MDWIELMEAPNGTVFCEEEEYSTPLYIKRDTLSRDILVIPLFSVTRNGSPRKLGIDQIPQNERDEIEFRILTENEKHEICKRLMFGAITVDENSTENYDYH